MEKPTSVRELMPGFVDYLRDMWDVEASKHIKTNGGVSNFNDNHDGSKDVAKKNLDSK